jgi:hypothetical protein
MPFYIPQQVSAAPLTENASMAASALAELRALVMSDLANISHTCGVG